MLGVLILVYRRRFSGLGYNRNIHIVLFVFVSRWVAGLLRPRPFLNKLSTA
jgi:hypothetical protein